MGVHPKRRWGQHFLIDQNIIKKIVKTIAPKPYETIIEIGAGTGSLTQYLVESDATIHAIEIDKELFDILKQKFANKPNLFLYHSDVLKFNFNSIYERYRVVRFVGNIPYNITSPLISVIFENVEYIQDIHFLVQKEIAVRIAAKPGNKEYGILSVLVQSYGIPEREFDISRNVFQPVPDVTSSLLSIKIRPTQRSKDFQRSFNRVVRAAFNQRRKILKNSLSNLIKYKNTEPPIDLNRRAETLTVSEFIKLTEWIYNF